MDQFAEGWKVHRFAGRGSTRADSIAGRRGSRPSSFFWSVKSRCFQALEHIGEFVLEVDPARPEEIGKARAFYAGKLRLALPVIIREDQFESFRELIASLPDQQKWEAANVGGLNLLRRVGSPGLQEGEYDITADWPLYTLNTQAALQWREQGVGQFVLSPEDDADRKSVV